LVSSKATVDFRTLTQIASCMCGTYFSRATKKRIGLEALAEAIDSKSSETTHGRAYKDASSSHRGEGVQDYSILRSEHDRLKNVRWSEEEHLELGSSDHKFEMEKPISNDALVYLDLIKSTFPAHPEIYNTFVETMQAFEKYSIDTLETVTRISGSFYEEKALSNDIKTFSSRGYTFQIDPHSDSHTIRIIAPDSITHTIIARAKRKQLDELDNREPDSIENGIDFVDQRKKRQKKPRRGSILANSDKP
jgi:histone deacetylase complex regulatory component SIN3